MTKGTHLLRSALLALLALAVISGGSLAAGDLFDDDYKDCPYKTRLRDGQIDDLSVNRDSMMRITSTFRGRPPIPRPGVWDPMPTARPS